MTGEWRAATAADAGPLADLERDANLVALAHVFPADLPFPYDEVRQRWERTLAEPGATVEVVDGAGRLDAYVAHDGETLRHLAVHPGRWGEGLGADAVARAVARGAHRLWCLEANEQARRLYTRLGWRPSGLTGTAEWPPHPVEIEYVVPGALRSPT
ncbi:hypothetical protein GCM10009623_03540 [Nocardioides aestuarii]|uniref:GNAT family N-acetyltransferase n=1 Tax=Nocardioides aestuarii TaxID=252231 RepID=A0ABW4TH73_9ACTN